MNKISSLIWGILLVFVGVVVGLNSLNITNIDIFFNGWWTLFIIIPCFIDMFRDHDKTGSIIGIIIGISLLLASNDVISFSIIWKLMIPFILVIVGLSIIFKDVLGGKVRDKIKKLNKHNNKEYAATFSGQDLDFTNEEFDGCDLNAIFGGVKCDLRKAIIKKDCVINVSAIFGGITIFVSDDVNVKISSKPIFGGVSDERKDRKYDNKYTVYINATSMFGGVEIK